MDAAKDYLLLVEAREARYAGGAHGLVPDPAPYGVALGFSVVLFCVVIMRSTSCPVPFCAIMSHECIALSKCYEKFADRAILGTRWERSQRLENSTVPIAWDRFPP